MGNKLARRRQVVEDKYTRPQGLYQHRDVDHKKLRKLILDSKLAPCYPGDDDCDVDLEECPICFLYYPSLNRSRCCAKGICTECFLQMKPPQATRPTQCPFCKTPNYAVEYRGARTKEEKGKEQIEEQMVIEAKIRMLQQERQDEEERSKKKMKKQESLPSMTRVVTTGEVEYQEPSGTSTLVQGEASTASQHSYTMPLSAARRPSYSRLNREDDFDLDLEELMVMEAIWLSIQERDANRITNPVSVSPVPPFSEECYASTAMVPAETPPRGLACAAAQLAECQHIPDESPSVSGVNEVSFDMSPSSSCYPTGDVRLIGNYTPESCIEVSHGGGRALPMVRALPMEGQWIATPPVLPEVGTSYASSDIIPHAGTGMPFPVPPDAYPLPTGHLVPETFEEQMMFAMAVSLAEARTRTNTQGLTWM